MVIGYKSGFNAEDVSLLLTKYFQFLWQGKFDMNL